MSLAIPIQSSAADIEAVAIELTAPIAEGPADIIPGFMPRKGELVIAGMTNVGKSLSALEIISALQTGDPLWGVLEPTVKINKVAYVLAEHYPEVIQRLALKTQLRFPMKVYVLGPEQLAWDKWLINSGRPNIQAIEKYKRWFEGVDLVVWDPLSAFAVGVEEDDNIAMRLLIQTMSDICHSVGASCLVLAHQGKPIMDPKGIEHARKSYAIRGASAIEDASTNIFYMNKTEGVMNGYEMVCRKYKGDAPEAYKLIRDPNTLTHVISSNHSSIEIKRKEYMVKMGRLESYNYQLDYQTRVKLIAAMEGISEQQIWKYLGKEMPR